jgi:hypothetical protein
VPSVFFTTHPDVAIDPAVPIPDWPLKGMPRSLLRFARQALPVEKITRPWRAVQQHCGRYAWRGELLEPCAVSRVARRL